METDYTDSITLAGAKQSQKAIRGGLASAAYIAEDADENVTSPIVNLCNQHGVEVIRIATMTELGAICGIQVGAAVAVRLK